MKTLFLLGIVLIGCGKSYVDLWNEHRVAASCHDPSTGWNTVCTDVVGGKDDADKPDFSRVPAGYKVVFYTSANPGLPTGWVIKKGQYNETDFNGAQTAKTVAKPEKPPVNSVIFSADPISTTPLATFSRSDGMHVYKNEVLIARCDSAGEWGHETVSNCVVADGHTLTEVMQVWLESEQSEAKSRQGEITEYDRRYQVLWQAFHDYVMQSKKDLQAIHDALQGKSPKGAKP